MRTIVVGLLIAASLVACDGSRSLSSTDRVSLTEHEQQWDARGFHSYAFDYSESSLGRSSNVHIVVQDDTVATVVDTDTGQPPETPMSWPTIDALFGEANAAATQDGVRLNLTYDDRYGYPTLLSISSTQNNPGGGFVARVSNLQPIE
jgi:hypothetical protein